MIRGLMDRARFPRLGVIRLGRKETRTRVRNGREETYDLPVETPYFVLPPELKRMLGEEPTRIQVLFPHEEIDRVLVTNYIRYQGGLLTVECDGLQSRRIPVQGAEHVVPCAKPPYEPGKPVQPCTCEAKAVGRLNVLVLNGPGIYQVVIGGEQRLADLWHELRLLRQVFGARFTSTVFDLVRERQDRQTRDKDGKRLTIPGYPVRVHSPVSMLEAYRGSAADLVGLTPQLPSATIVEEEESEGAPDEAGAEHDDGAEWNLERCFAAAKDAGLLAPVYREALELIYGRSVDDLDFTHLAEQAAGWTKAATEPDYRDKWVGRLRERAAKARA